VISTYERPELVSEALQQIAAQEYPGHVETVVVDDSAESLEGQFGFSCRDGVLELPRDAGVQTPIGEVRYIHLRERMSIGAKRNLAIKSTDAEVLCVWDDDDVFTKDRLRKQVEHLRGEHGNACVNCSAIEVASIYSVPDRALHIRPPKLPQLVYENTLCFTRQWWDRNGYEFGEPWEVSGQGEGTLQLWWSDVRALTGAEEPFLYIYLPSSVSGGTALYLDKHPAPGGRMFALARGLASGRFPTHLPGPHVSTALSGARAALENMLNDPELFEHGNMLELMDLDAFCDRYSQRGRGSGA